MSVPAWLLPSKRSGTLLAAAVVIAVIGTAAWLVIDEVRTHRLQAARLAGIARELRFEVRPGPSDAIRFPEAGPYDERLGYRQLPEFVGRLERQGFRVSAQARMSPGMIDLLDRGVFAIYREKDQAGLELRECRGEPTFVARFPQRVYARFESVPSLLVDALLFVEDRDLLDGQQPTRNPAIEWDRLAKAVVDQAWRMVDGAHPAHGGSTLATQIEKYRHSPDGRTESATEKLRQMASASLRAYLDGEDTLARRREIVTDYLNTVPLAARPGFGEVNGIGDGLWAWYGRDFTEINRLLGDGDDEAPMAEAALRERATAFKQALSLMIAQRRPSWYLFGGEADLAGLTDSYLRLMERAGMISPALRDAALAVRLQRQAQPPPEPAISFTERKAATAVRARLSAMLDVPRAYDLDRLDLAARSTLDGEAQHTATRVLRGLADPATARAAGLYGHNLLQPDDDPGKLVFSFTLFERGERANLLRVQTDNFDQPFDINEGARLDLGSTAKLRTLVTYLELVADLHARWSGLAPAQLEAVAVSPRDALGRWAKDYLLRSGADATLAAMLEAALQRRYSASPAEEFFTGGGLHRFGNFEAADNNRVLTVREALERSVNLVFIRLMRDIVHHLMFKVPGSSATLLEDRSDPARQEYLSRFADREGREFIARFYRKYQGKSPQEAEELLLQGVRASPRRLSTLFLELEPDADADALGRFLAQQLPGNELSAQTVRALHEKQGPRALPSLADRGYVAGVHPLELWLVGFLRRHPEATLGETYAASRAERQEVYGWLFKTRNKNAQDVRIRSLLEVEAFLEVQRAWHRLGYPFDALTPSYATALGASGDRPAALAELMGILVNDGLRLPVARIESLAFARGTPYETRLDFDPPPAERVLPREVAQAARSALLGVVERGTARRLAGTLARPDGTPLAIGGKTGTGDHRFDVYGRGGQLISSRVVSRSATFVFLIGERYYGTMMAYVREPYAARYRFTSALPTQLLKSLAPALLPFLDRPDSGPACVPLP